MSNNIEYEKRVMLSKEQYLEVKNDYINYSNKHCFSLINYYFDDEDLSLRHHSMMLRIRSINNEEFELTLKVKLEHGDLEINEPITKEDVDNLIKNFSTTNEEINNYISNATSKKIIYLTKLETNRIEVPYDDHLLVIDENKYSDVVDYDMEIESSSRKKAEEIILSYCNKYQLEYKKDYQSKSRRALSKLSYFSARL